jgi:hypothetical protein
MALNWDSVVCQEKGCVVDHMRLSDSDTGEILAWVHGPNGLGACELMNGVDQTVGCFIDSASAIQAAHKYVESVWSAKSDKAALATMLAAPSTPGGGRRGWRGGQRGAGRGLSAGGAYQAGRGQRGHGVSQLIDALRKMASSLGPPEGF